MMHDRTAPNHHHPARQLKTIAFTALPSQLHALHRIYQPGRWW
jgi:hypothetical protein